jgi:hypothetical protein
MISFSLKWKYDSEDHIPVASYIYDSSVQEWTHSEKIGSNHKPNAAINSVEYCTVQNFNHMIQWVAPLGLKWEIQEKVKHTHQSKALGNGGEGNWIYHCMKKTFRHGRNIIMFWNALHFESTMWKNEQCHATTLCAIWTGLRII